MKFCSKTKIITKITKLLMFKLWERQVFHNINDQITNKLKNISPDQIESKLRMSGRPLLKLILN